MRCAVLHLIESDLEWHRWTNAWPNRSANSRSGRVFMQGATRFDESGFDRFSARHRWRFRVVQAPSEITILEVVVAVEELSRIESCPLGLPAHCENLCLLHREMDGAFAHIEAIFADTTLAEMIGESLEKVLCDE